MLSSVSPHIGVTISTSRWHGVEVLLITVHQSLTGSYPHNSSKMCGHFKFYHYGLCPNCNKPGQKLRVYNKNACFLDKDADRSEPEIVEDWDKCIRGKDFLHEFNRMETPVTALQRDCIDCQLRGSYRLEVAEALERGDDVDSSDPGLGDIRADPSRYRRGEQGLDLKEAQARRYLMAQDISDAEDRELAQKRAHYETTNLAPHPDRDYPYWRSDRTETHVQPETSTNPDDIRAWTEKAGFPYQILDRSQPSSSSGRPSAILEEPSNIEGWELFRTQHQEERHNQRQRRSAWVDQVTDPQEDDFEDPHTNRQGLSYPPERSGYTPQDELASPFERTRFPIRQPAYADEQQRERDQFSSLQEQTGNVVESEDMYGGDSENSEHENEHAGSQDGTRSRYHDEGAEEWNRAHPEGHTQEHMRGYVMHGGQRTDVVNYGIGHESVQRHIASYDTQHLMVPGQRHHYDPERDLPVLPQREEEEAEPDDEDDKDDDEDDDKEDDEEEDDDEEDDEERPMPNIGKLNVRRS